MMRILEIRVLLVLFGKFLATRLLFRLLGIDPCRFISLKGGVFVQDTAFGKGWLFFIADLLVVFLAFVGATKVFHSSAAEGGNDLVFHCMGLLFAAVLLSLSLIILGPLYLSFRAIDPEFGFTTLSEVSLKFRWVPFG
jgi:hypothetical protein